MKQPSKPMEWRDFLSMREKLRRETERLVRSGWTYTQGPTFSRKLSDWEVQYLEWVERLKAEGELL